MINQANFNIANAFYLDSLRKAEEARKRGDPIPPVLRRPATPIQWPAAAGSVGRRGYWRGRWSGSGSSNGARRRAGGHGCGDEYRER